MTVGRRARHAVIGLAVAGALAACSSQPPAPEWQMNAKGSVERALSAYLTGNTRVEALEFAKARAEVARTGQAGLVARVELTRCAARVASLVFEDCPAFGAVATDAPPAERAYAAWLAGNADAGDIALLPSAQREAAGSAAPADALGRIGDPLSRLVAAGVLLRSGRATPAVFTTAIDTASAQGWSRPLLAWLTAQAQRAEQGGDAEEAARLRRRIGLVRNAPATAAVPAAPAAASAASAP